MYKYVSNFAPYILKYIDLKRSSGYKFHCTEPFLAFDRFASEKNISVDSLTREVCDVWGQKRPNESDATRYKRINAVRNLAYFMNSLGIKAHVPQLPRNCKSTFVPHIYSYDEIRRFFTECDKVYIAPMTFSAPLYPALFRLLYGTGIRVGDDHVIIRLKLDKPSKYAGLS